MSRVNIIFFCLLSFSTSISYANMKCDVIGGSCPSLFNSNEKEYCCTNFNNGNEYCCTSGEFLEKAGIELPIILGVGAVIAIFICCICCACCKCCPCYRKRERGAVYVVSGPRTVVQINRNLPPAEMNYGNNLNPSQMYSTQPGMPQPPPSYTSEGYTKQSPYNPMYPNI